ncbi:hypothetical protein ACFQ46_15000 [Kineococcus sp. GCM10028916]|uniref:hypothetical protein n=1 Tax=Kineococcus sp. GCM10028916 TaxID=3273394 RepID=UPI003634E69B
MAARFNPAPGWPSAPAGWLPPAGWKPDPGWPPAPAGWPIVVNGTGFPHTPSGRPRASTRTPRGRVLHLLRGTVSH